MLSLIIFIVRSCVVVFIGAVIQHGLFLLQVELFYLLVQTLLFGAVQHDTIGDNDWYAHETKASTDCHHEWDDGKFAGCPWHVYNDAYAESFVKYSLLFAIVVEFVGESLRKRVEWFRVWESCRVFHFSYLKLNPDAVLVSFVSNRLNTYLGKHRSLKSKSQFQMISITITPPYGTRNSIINIFIWVSVRRFTFISIL